MSGLTYQLSVGRPNALLGEPVVLTLTCTATTDAPGAITFDHPSLVLSLETGEGEPRLHMPNVTAFESGGMLVRVQMPGGTEDLRPGETRRREFVLYHAFPETLDVGSFELSFRLEESPEPMPRPVRVSVRSGPDAVAALLRLLDDEQLETRQRAAALLHRMTGRGLDYDPAEEPALRAQSAAYWRDWWEANGPTMTWDSRADRVRVDRIVPRNDTVDQGKLGAVVLHAVVPLDATRDGVLRHLAAWQKAPTLVALVGAERVADAVVEYPLDPDVPEWDAEVEQALASAVSTLTVQARAGADHAAEGLIIVTTIPARDSAVLTPALHELAETLAGSDVWRPVWIAAGVLLDAMDPARVPVGHV